MVRCGIIGTGIIARAHAEGLIANPDAQITAVCDIVPEKMKLFKADMSLENAEEYTDYKALIDSGKVDAVYVCTPNVSHCEISVYAAMKKIHVFCEKPLAMDSSESLKILQAAKDNDIIHMVGFAFRCIPALAYIKDLIDSGRLGEPRMFRGRFFANRLAPEDHPLEWRHLNEIAGSGVIGDLICHVLDISHYLLYDYQDIKKICAFGNIIIPERYDDNGVLRKVTADENVVVYMENNNMVQITLEGSRYAPFEMSFHISGTKGAVKYNMAHYNQVEELFYEKEGVYSQKYSQTYQMREIPEQYKEYKISEGRFVRQSFKFIECIEKHCGTGCDFEEGHQNQQVLDLIINAYNRN